MKHYMNIERIKPKYSDMFVVGEEITITTKVDGANASFTYDPNLDSIIAFSRQKQLSEVNTLRGFWEWTQRLAKNLIASATQNGRYVVFGEWLVSHTVKYPASVYNTFYMFDVYDTAMQHYLPHEEVVAIFSALEIAASRNGEFIKFVPVLYEGPFVSWEHCMNFLSIKTLGGIPCEEGIVIKTQDRLKDKDNSHRPKYIKIVNEQFSEVHKDHKKPIDPEELKKKEALKDYVATYATRRRIEKLLEKCVDNGELPSDWDEHNMKWIASHLPKYTYEDIRKEEPEAVLSVDNFGKICGAIVMETIRTILKEKNNGI